MCVCVWVWVCVCVWNNNGPHHLLWRMACSLASSLPGSRSFACTADSACLVHRYPGSARCAWPASSSKRICLCVCVCVHFHVKFREQQKQRDVHMNTAVINICRCFVFSALANPFPISYSIFCVHHPLCCVFAQFTHNVWFGWCLLPGEWRGTNGQ